MDEFILKPEGSIITTLDNEQSIKDIESLEKARKSGKILEAKAVVCDSDHNLIVELPFCKAIIKREDVAIGISDGSVRDIAIITRVNKPVCFVVKEIQKSKTGEDLILLSRKEVQIKAVEYINKNLIVGDVIDAKITHLETFGAFADIGYGVIALMTIDNISVSRIAHPSDRFFVGQTIKAIIKEIDSETGKISLTHKELLGTWNQNIQNFKAGQTVGGIVRSIESYGVFIELAPNLAGLAEFKEGLYKGQSASVYIKSILPDKMKIKLSIVDAFTGEEKARSFKYFYKEKHIDSFIYSPQECKREIRTDFY